MVQKKFIRWLKELGVWSYWLHCYQNDEENKQLTVKNFLTKTTPSRYMACAFKWVGSNATMWCYLHWVWLDYHYQIIDFDESLKRASTYIENEI